MAFFAPALANTYPLGIEQLSAVDSASTKPVPAASAPWRNVEQGRLRLAENDWLRITIPPIASTQPLYLITPRRSTGELALWMPDATQAILSDHYRGPFPQTLSSRYHVFEVPQNLPAGLTLLVESRGQESTLKPELLDRDTLFERDHKNFGFDVALRTLLLSIVLVNLLTWVMLRERVYATYAAYILVMVAAFSAHDGSLYPIPILSAWGHLEYSGIWVLICISVVLLIAFARGFIETREHTRHADRALQFLQILFLANAVLGLLLFDEMRPILLWAYGAGHVATVALLLFGTARAIRERETRGWIFLAGFVPHGAAMIIQAGGLLGIIAMPGWVHTTFTVTVAFEASVFALGLAYIALLYRRQRDAALALAENDELTQVYNRRAIDRRLRQLCTMMKDAELSAIAVLFIDLDHFKRINDVYGHAAGDECLRQVAKLIQAELRLGDLLGRYGGEEFVVILPGSDRDDAHGIAERIRKRASLATFVAGPHQVRAHLSIGVASATGRESDASTLLSRADAAMYRSKTEGRNRVSLTA